MKKWYFSRKYQCMSVVFIIICVVYYLSTMQTLREQNLDLTRRGSEFVASVKNSLSKAGVNALDKKMRDELSKHIEQTLKENLKIDKGTGCKIPQLDPFAREMLKFKNDFHKVKCKGTDWVKCQHAVCRVVPKIISTHTDVLCYYRDIIHQSDNAYYIGSDTEIIGSDVYMLSKSDHASVSCTGFDTKNKKPSSWFGLAVGFRPVKQKKISKERQDSVNVLIFGFDSTSSNLFIRNMPESYKFMTEQLNMTILKGYNIVGDGTPAALFPLLTGKTELEFPDVRKSTRNKLDDKAFIFYKMKQLGYHTAYFEDMPWVGTFQYRFNGFEHRPADYYLRSFFREDAKEKRRVADNDGYCVGDIPRFRLMFNLTHQFLQLPGKKYGFTFIADITHDGNHIGNADEDLVFLMKTLIKDGRIDDTLFILMGDHGPRFSKLRQTIQGKLEERLPLMALHLPNKLVKKRPQALTYLQENANVLTTPHDIYATILDALDLREDWNPYKIEGADLKRGLSLLEPVPSNRSCSEAGIEAHWCACLTWDSVSPNDPMYGKVAQALLDYINSLTQSLRTLCVKRELKSIQWVNINRPARSVLNFIGAKDNDGYVGKFKDNFVPDVINYQIKITVSPGTGVYEASLRYITATKEFTISSRDISRTNAYNTEPHCISETLPHLNMYCYCKK